ncbi:MAG: HI0074 family nucleotidyltransferase substrate-binding subunit [Alphaproteobacteria bacterium]|jgi:nucleotidyltransferase substrate binding protein (TIGR01987 family)
MLDISSLKKALKTLEEVMALIEKNKVDNIIRDSAIQRFEYTYELSYKTLRRYLELTIPSNQELNEGSFNNLIRVANKAGLVLGTLKVWDGFREARNSSSHAYSEKVALKVVAVIPQFIKEVRYLIKQIESHE